MKNKMIPALGIALLLSSGYTIAADNTPNTFSEGQKTSAQEVNENFSFYEDSFLSTYGSLNAYEQTEKVENGAEIVDNNITYTVEECIEDVYIPDFDSEDGYKRISVTFLTGKADGSGDNVCDYLVYNTEIDNTNLSLLKVKEGDDLLVKHTSSGEEAISVGYKDKNIILENANKYSTRVISIKEVE